MNQRLTSDELKKLRNLAQQGNAEAIVALLDYRMEEVVEILKVCTSDHRYHQGKFQALKDFRNDIVRKPK